MPQGFVGSEEWDHGRSDGEFREDVSLVLRQMTTSGSIGPSAQAKKIRPPEVRWLFRHEDGHDSAR